jgi:hypothetical protein
LFLVDKDGNILDENGNYIPTVTYVDDEDKEVKAEENEKPTKKKKSTATDSE